MSDMTLDGIIRENNPTQTPVNYDEVLQKTTGLPLITTPQSPPASTGVNVLTPDEAAQLFGGTIPEGKKVDVVAEGDANAMAVAKYHAEKPVNEVLNLMDSALAVENARIEDFDKNGIPEDIKEEVRTVSKTKVEPNRTYTQSEINYDKISTTVTKETVAIPSIDTNDLVPSNYGDDEEDDVTITTIENNLTGDVRPDVNDRAAYKEYMMSLKTSAGSNTVQSPIRTVKDKKTAVVSEPGKRVDSKSLADAAFLNAITKYKKDNFRVVEIPLPNSGITVHMVGTSAMDINLLYGEYEENTTQIDYELEKLRITIRNIADAIPRIDRTMIQNHIHYVDYNFMAYAHIAATLKDVELAHDCKECGRDFRIIVPSEDLLMNADELADKLDKVRGSLNVNEHSLLATNRKVTTADGFTVILGHPSYVEYVKYLNELKAFYSTLEVTERARMLSMTRILPYVRSVTLHDGISAANIYQKYLGITMLSDSDMSEIEVEVANMRKEITTPVFGVKSVTCPYCKNEATNIRYDSLDSLIFFHITVTQLQNQIEEN